MTAEEILEITKKAYMVVSALPDQVRTEVCRLIMEASADKDPNARMMLTMFAAACMGNWELFDEMKTAAESAN